MRSIVCVLWLFLCVCGQGISFLSFSQGTIHAFLIPSLLTDLPPKYSHVDVDSCIAQLVSYGITRQALYDRQASMDKETFLFLLQQGEQALLRCLSDSVLVRELGTIIQGIQALRNVYIVERELQLYENIFSLNQQYMIPFGYIVWPNLVSLFGCHIVDLYPYRVIAQEHIGPIVIYRLRALSNVGLPYIFPKAYSWRGKSCIFLFSDTYDMYEQAIRRCLEGGDFYTPLLQYLCLGYGPHGKKIPLWLEEINRVALYMAARFQGLLGLDIAYFIEKTCELHEWGHQVYERQYPGKIYDLYEAELFALGYAWVLETFLPVRLIFLSEYYVHMCVNTLHHEWRAVDQLVQWAVPGSVFYAQWAEEPRFQRVKRMSALFDEVDALKASYMCRLGLKDIQDIHVSGVIYPIQDLIDVLGSSIVDELRMRNVPVPWNGNVGISLYELEHIIETYAWNQLRSRIASNMSTRFGLKVFADQLTVDYMAKKAIHPLEASLNRNAYVWSLVHSQV